ncbi:MAG: hypothetical protein DRG59_06030 [Deltaproteobacteria bacterium]|nr:MAG: hypothetical protein DRG59_06030 [Deltaproteobacteria bacterium]
MEKIVVESSGYRLSVVFHRPTADDYPVVICCHGLLSYKDSDKYRTIASALGKEQIGVVRFDFRGCGESEGELSNSHVSARLQDLKNVMEYVRGIEGFNGKLGLVGSSLGGFLSFLAAIEAEYEIPLALWATPISLKPLVSRIKASSILPFEPSTEYLDDLEKYEPSSQLDKLKKVLILHGSRDELVEPWNALEIFSGVDLPKELHVLNDADHRFTNHGARSFAVNATSEWFKRYLS